MQFLRTLIYISLPSIEVIEYYYSNIYRKEGRAHFVANPNQTSPGTWQKAQYSYISLFTNFDGIVMDVSTKTYNGSIKM